jgi:hypothetical protein
MNMTEKKEPNNDTETNPEYGAIVFSGGTAFNSYVEMFQSIAPRSCYILPVSDDGGSTAEIIRFLGGPAIGDMRSRIVRLARNVTKEDRAIKELLSFRLPNFKKDAITEWESILHLRHSLWDDISGIHAMLISSSNGPYNSSLPRTLSVIHERPLDV